MEMTQAMSEWNTRISVFHTISFLLIFLKHNIGYTTLNISNSSMLKCPSSGVLSYLQTEFLMMHVTTLSESLYRYV